MYRTGPLGPPYFHTSTVHTLHLHTSIHTIPTPVCTRVRSTLASRRAGAAAWTATPTSCGHRPQTDAHSPGRRGCRLRDRRRGKQELPKKMREGKQESSPLPPSPRLTWKQRVGRGNPEGDVAARMARGVKHTDLSGGGGHMARSVKRTDLHGRWGGGRRLRSEGSKGGGRGGEGRGFRIPSQQR